tara:strand:+ start:284 stop:673 length:390 start_codon:yes stop_codon:yes gene_type:complete
MARKSKAKFKMKGHTLPGINQKSETENLKDGRSPSSAFQMKEPGDSPNKLIGGLVGGALLGKTKFGKNLMNTGKTLLGGGLGKIFGGKSGSGATGGIGDATAGTGEATGAGAQIKEEAKQELKEEIAQS